MVLAEDNSFPKAHVPVARPIDMWRDDGPPLQPWESSIALISGSQAVPVR